MRDFRLIAAVTALLVTLLGYIGLVMTSHPAEAKDLLTLVGLPALTFIIGLGSDLRNNING